MASEVECILCFTALSKSPNRYLVQNKGEFSVQDEISDLDFVVHPTSPQQEDFRLKGKRRKAVCCRRMTKVIIIRR